MVVKDKGGKKTNLDVLQYALATVSGLAFLLLILLLAILLKRKLASKFKLFDEKSRCHLFPFFLERQCTLCLDVADDYQTMSSFPSRSNSATTTLPPSRLASVSSPSASSSTTHQLPPPSSSSPSSPTPPPPPSSSSPPPPAAVLRSLNNIRPTVVDQTGRTVVL